MGFGRWLAGITVSCLLQGKLDVQRVSAGRLFEFAEAPVLLQQDGTAGITAQICLSAKTWLELQVHDWASMSFCWQPTILQGMALVCARGKRLAGTRGRRLACTRASWKTRKPSP